MMCCKCVFEKGKLDCKLGSDSMYLFIYIYARPPTYCTVATYRPKERKSTSFGFTCSSVMHLSQRLPWACDSVEKGVNSFSRVYIGVFINGYSEVRRVSVR